MCRLGRDGIQDGWSPIRLLDALRGLAPDLAGEFDTFNETLRQALEGAPRVDRLGLLGQAGPWVADYLKAVEQWCGVAVSQEDVARSLEEKGSRLPSEFPTDVEACRAALAEVDASLQAAQGLSLSPEDAVTIRQELESTHSDLYGEPTAPHDRTQPGLLERPQARNLLDVEIVAMYW